jgi:hypothetical protein
VLKHFCHSTTTFSDQHNCIGLRILVTKQSPNVETKIVKFAVSRMFVDDMEEIERTNLMNDKLTSQLHFHQYELPSELPGVHPDWRKRVLESKIQHKPQKTTTTS